jgi:hypothetical protein
VGFIDEKTEGQKSQNTVPQKKCARTLIYIGRVGGRACPELDRFLNRLEHADLFQACLEREGWDTWAARRGRYPALTCRNGGKNKESDSNLIENACLKWKKTKELRSHYCTRTVYIS